MTYRDKASSSEACASSAACAGARRKYILKATHRCGSSGRVWPRSSCLPVARKAVGASRVVPSSSLACQTPLVVRLSACTLRPALYADSYGEWPRRSALYQGPCAERGCGEKAKGFRGAPGSGKTNVIIGHGAEPGHVDAERMQVLKGFTAPELSTRRRRRRRSVSRSIGATLRPLRASAIEAAQPATPPPRMRTSSCKGTRFKLDDRIGAASFWAEKLNSICSFRRVFYGVAVTRLMTMLSSVRGAVCEICPKDF